MKKPITIYWCEKMFVQQTDAIRAFDCERELDHKGNCDSRSAQTVRKEFAEQIWNAPKEASV